MSADGSPSPSPPPPPSAHGTREPRPAARWEDAFLRGNGRHGAMAFGDPDDDRVVVTHHTLARPNGGEHAGPSEPAAQLPQLYLLTDAAIDNLVAYVRGGGTLVSGFLTGVADEDDRVRPGGMDERLRKLFGIRTLHEWWPLDADETAECEGFRGTLWSEEIEIEIEAEAGEAEKGAVAEARYKGGELDGLPAVLRKERAWYVSTLPEPAALRGLLAGVASGAGVRPVLDGLPPQVEAVRRGDLLFVLNHGREAVTVRVPGTYRDLLTGQQVTESLELERLGAAVLSP